MHGAAQWSSIGRLWFREEERRAADLLLFAFFCDFFPSTSTRLYLIRAIELSEGVVVEGARAL